MEPAQLRALVELVVIVGSGALVVGTLRAQLVGLREAISELRRAIEHLGAQHSSHDARIRDLEYATRLRAPGLRDDDR